MALTLARALLPLLAVTMVTVAAPLAEQASGEEMAEAVLGDSNSVDIAKRAKEEIVFGNQQNSARMGAAKKSMEPETPLLSQENAQTVQQEAAADEQPKADGPEQPAQAAGDPAKEEAKPAVPEEGSEPMESAAGPQSSEEKAGIPEDQPSSGEQDSQPASSDQSNPTEPQDSQDPQQPAAQDPSSEEVKEEEEEEGEGEAGESESQPVPVEGGEHGTGEGEGEEQHQNNDQQLVPVQEGGVVSAPEETPAEGTADESQLLPDAEDSPVPDSEAALQALDQPQEVGQDDVEGLLKDLHNAAQEEGDSADGGDAGKTVDDEDGNAERELMEVSNQAVDGNMVDSEYKQSLLKYILSHGDEYGRLPQASSSSYLYSSDPYYLQRRRRSPTTGSRFPHIHRRQHGNEKALSRAKRTKRDLFDDNLYYNLDLPFNRQEEEEEEAREEEEEEEKNEELQELITYLMALYPAVYHNDRPTTQLPAYLWQGASYPEEEEAEELEAEEPYWAEPSAYEEPRVGWQEPEPQDLSPAWEPSFYPEELEDGEEGGVGEEEEGEPDFYPVAAKREMMSFVPGQRRKRYFFPFAREPYTHWGAFVPSQQKRQYYQEDPYRRLRELAMVLAEDRQMPSYFDSLDDYKKK